MQSGVPLGDFSARLSIPIFQVVFDNMSVASILTQIDTNGSCLESGEQEKIAQLVDMLAKTI